MHATCVSAACRPAEQRRRRGEIGSVQRSIFVGQICPNGRQKVMNGKKLRTGVLVGECLQTKVRGCSDMRLIQEHTVAGTCN